MAITAGTQPPPQTPLDLPSASPSPSPQVRDRTPSRDKSDGEGARPVLSGVEGGRGRVQPTTTRPTCPRCRRPTGLLLDRPALGDYHPVYRCDGRLGGCGFLWSPA